MKIHLKSAVATVLVAVAVLLSSTGLLADVTGSITGVVHDPRQAVVTGATVQVTNVQTNVSQQATTGADGAYHFLALSKISPMPEGLVNILNKNEILDLLAYIESGGKQTAAAFSKK